MIEVPEGIDRGQALYDQFPDTITNAVIDRKSSYFDSVKVYKSLKKRCGILDDIIDLRFKSNDAFVAEVALPIGRKRKRELDAFIRKYFENDPLVTYTELPGTPEEFAKNRQMLVNKNWVSTHFRKNALHWLIDSLGRYGACCGYTQAVEGYGQGGKRLMYNVDGFGSYGRMPTQNTRKNAITYPIHILNYFCDVNSSYSNVKPFEGFIDTWTVAQLRMCLNDENYIAENVEKILQSCKKGTSDKDWYGGNGLAEKRDETRYTFNVNKFWGKLQFSGNEDDDTEYYIEFVDNKIIRIHESELDCNERPIKTGCLLTRPEVWWGNTDLEDVIPHQNVSNWLINTQIEGTMRLMDRFIMMPKGKIDISAINNRHQLGGVVYYDGAFDPSREVFQLQQKDYALQNLDWLNRELKQSVQESSPVVNLQNKYNEGGLNNSTLGAAQMVASIGEILQSDMMQNVSWFIESVADVSANILTNVLDDQFMIPSQNGGKVINKYEMMGDFECQTVSSLTMNDVQEFTDWSNKLTQFLNWMGTGHPAFQNINMERVVKDIVSSGFKKYGDPDKYWNPQPQIQQQPMQGQIPQQGMPQQGQPPMPQPTGAAINA